MFFRTGYRIINQELFENKKQTENAVIFQKASTELRQNTEVQRLTFKKGCLVQKTTHYYYCCNSDNQNLQ